MTRRALVVGNWKMNGTEPEAARLVADLLPRIASSPVDADVAVAPPFTSLRSVGEMIRGTSLALAAQNVHSASHGAFTGEISAAMLAALDVRYVIVGHSERRRLFGETDDVVARKASAAHAAGLVPIVCVGEEETQRMDGQTLAVIERQLDAALATLGTVPNLRSVDGTSLVIAYEPIWAIGTGRTASVDQVEEVHGAARAFLVRRLGPVAGEQIRILYGGSVTADNAAKLLAASDVDGALVGGASLVAEAFALIAAAAVSH